MFTRARKLTLPALVGTMALLGGCVAYPGYGPDYGYAGGYGSPAYAYNDGGYGYGYPGYVGGGYVTGGYVGGGYVGGGWGGGGWHDHDGQWHGGGQWHGNDGHWQGGHQAYGQGGGGWQGGGRPQTSLASPHGIGGLLPPHAAPAPAPRQGGDRGNHEFGNH